MTSNPNRLSVLNTHWHNQSLSSVTSDAATFHSAQAHMELSHLEASGPQSSLASTLRPQSPKSTLQRIPVPPKIEATDMARQDSGFSDGIQSTPSSSRRTSTSSTRRRTKRATTSCSSTRRPSTKRAPRSSPTTAQVHTSISSKRPFLNTRHTAPYPPTSTPYQFYQFPTLQDAPRISEPEHAVAAPPPPITCQYWTSDNTRRLEYAAIDAASRGFRGFFIKLVPDCILPPKARRTRFHKEDDGDSDAGSVRRYRIPLPELEQKGCPLSGKVSEKSDRPGLLKRFTSIGKGR